MQGRFTSPDEFTGGPDELFNFADDASDNPTFYAELDKPQSLNKYQYTYNNPVNAVDPDGHCLSCAAAAAAAGVIILMSAEPVNAPRHGDRTYQSGDGLKLAVTAGAWEVVGVPLLGKAISRISSIKVRPRGGAPARQVRTQAARGATSGGLKGSGPVPGVLEVSPRVQSTAAFRNYNPRNGADFVFDSNSNTFVVGHPRPSAGLTGSPHQ